MKKNFPIILFAVLFAACGNRIKLSSLTVEMQESASVNAKDVGQTDLFLATSEPRFSWNYDSEVENVKQVDYRIVVASSEENARKGIGDLWDWSGEGEAMLYIPYGGKPLKSRDRCWWKLYTTVTYGDKGKRKSLESEVKHFEISLLSPDDWQAHWIGRDFDDDILDGKTRIPARYLRKEFRVGKEVERARLYISGLGSYRAFVGGQEVAPDEMLKPALSDYTQRVYFNAYDVTSYLFPGETAIGVVVAGGRFTAVRYDSTHIEWCGITHSCHYGKPMLIAQLEITYSDGTTDIIVTDSTWRITDQGPIRTSNEFDGETYNFSYDLAMGAWLHAGYNYSNAERSNVLWLPVIDSFDRQNMDFNLDNNPRYKPRYSEPKPIDPKVFLSPQPNPNIRVQERIKPVDLFRKGDAWILDMGQNMVGLLELKDLSSLLAHCTRVYDTVTLRYAETLTADSMLYTANLRSAECTDRIVASPCEMSWHPSFVYHGFRYVEITGLPEGSRPRLSDFEGLVMYDAMRTTGSFECSNDIMNAVYRNAFWGIRGNYRSMPTDCPQRDERMGWTGDRTTGCYGESYLFANHLLYAKWLQDMADCQWDNGMISDVVPAYWRNYTDNMTWQGAFITVADMLYTRFGDIGTVRRHYDGMKRWLLHNKDWYLKEGIFVRDTYGDWCVPPESPELIHTRDTNRMTRPGNLSTPYYYHFCEIMKGFALLLHKEEDAVFFQEEMDYVAKAYNARYLDTITGRYDHNTVTANLLPLWFGMVQGREMRQKVLANIVDKTENEFGGHVSTGVVGIQHLMRALTENGRGDLALRLAANDTYPSWGYMAKKGATTIWELWNGDTGDPAMNSGNHVMLLGDLLLWEYEYLAGIRALVPGYTTICLKPYPIEGLDYVRCSYNSVSGRIESNWRRKGNRFEWDILIPANTTAEVYLPTRNGHAERRILYSGRHHLESQLKVISD